MKKIFIIFISLLTVASCTSNNQKIQDASPLDQKASNTVNNNSF